MQKFGFRIKTRGGMVVENLLVSARDRGEAERKLLQIYHHCEILDCHEAEHALKEGSQSLSLEDAIALIARESDADPPPKN